MKDFLLNGQRPYAVIVENVSSTSPRPRPGPRPPSTLPPAPAPALSLERRGGPTVVHELRRIFAFDNSHKEGEARFDGEKDSTYGFLYAAKPPDVGKQTVRAPTSVAGASTPCPHGTGYRRRQVWGADTRPLPLFLVRGVPSLVLEFRSSESAPRSRRDHNGIGSSRRDRAEIACRAAPARACSARRF